LQEGLRRTIESYAHLKAENQPNTKREGPSKASKYLGSGRGVNNQLYVSNFFVGQSGLACSEEFIG